MSQGKGESHVLSLIPRLGGKAKLALDLADIINWTQHRYGLKTYIEPMGGGARTLLNIRLFQNEYYCEYEKGVANVFKCAADRNLVDHFVEMLRETEVNEEIFEWAKAENVLYNGVADLQRSVLSLNDRLATEADFEEAWGNAKNRTIRTKLDEIKADKAQIRELFLKAETEDDILQSGVVNYFLAHWSWSAKMEKFKEVKPEATHLDSIDRYKNKLDGIYEIHERLVDVNVMYGDGIKLVEKFADDKDTLIYCDPPYVTRKLDEVYIKNENKEKKDKSYANGWSIADHERFAEVLNSCKGMVILSGYDSAIYRDLYKGWTKCFLERLTNSSVVLTDEMRAGTDKKKKTEDEYIWLNYDIPMTDTNRYGIM